MSTLKERIVMVAKQYFGTQRNMANTLHISETGMAHWVKNGHIPAKQVMALCQHCHDLSREWLEDGVGEMRGGRFEVGSERSEMRGGRFEVRGGRFEVGSERSEITDRLIPFYEDVMVACGVVSFYEQRETPVMACIPGCDADFLLRASGESMEPVISPGDLIGVKDVGRFESLHRNQAYLIITNDAKCMVKYVEDPGPQSPYLLLTTENPDYYMSDSDRHLEKDTVRKMMKVTYIGKSNPFRRS